MEAAAARSQGLIDRCIAYAWRHPGSVLATVFALHLAIWTILPILTSRNLELDLAEDLALGKEWQLGYWKHPPLPWWIADLIYRLTGQIDAVYVLGPLSAVVCMYLVWRLASEVVEPVPALVAVLALEGMHFYNFSVVKFAHDQLQLPIWSATIWIFYRALTRGRASYWIGSGILLALAFWTKYAAVPLAITLGLFLLVEPQARRAWRGPGPYLMALAFAVVIAPHVWWLVAHDFMPFLYVQARAEPGTDWFDVVLFPLRWILSQVFFISPTLLLLALIARPQRPLADGANAVFARRYVTALAFGPFLITTLSSMAANRLPVAMWGYPLWSFMPLAVLMWWPKFDMSGLRRFATVFVIIFFGLPVVYAGTELFAPTYRDRYRANQFPGRELADLLTRQWRERTGTPLVYVGGAEHNAGAGRGEFPANNVAVYSPDRPHVIVHGELRFSPWIDPADLERRGAVLVWQQFETTPDYVPDNLRAAFPRAEVQPRLVLPRQILFPGGPEYIGYAIVPPQP